MSCNGGSRDPTARTETPHEGAAASAALPARAKQALETARLSATELPLGDDKELLRGRFKTGADAVELAVRYATIGWLQAIDSEAWQNLLCDVFGAVRDQKPYRAPGAFTFGDWTAVFGAIPRVLEHRVPPMLHAKLGTLKRVLTKGKAQQRLDTHVGVRDKVEHLA